MKLNVLPADSYIVVNKTILSDTDRKILTMLYQPIIGQLPISLYFSLWSDLDKLEIMSTELTHHHLMSTMKLNLNDIIKAREQLEAVGLLKTYVKEEDSINNFIYEIYSPLTADEFLNHPILNIVLYNNIGKKEYDKIVKYFKIPKINLKDFKDITASFTEVFGITKNSSFEQITDIKKKNHNKLDIKKDIDFSLLFSALPKSVVNKNTFTDDIKELITNLSFIYDLDILELENIVRSSMNEKGIISKVQLRKNARNYYQFENNSELPNLIYKSQPSYLTTELTGVSKREKIIHSFETLTPYQFLKGKQNNAEPTTRDLKLLERLLVDYELTPGVVNVLIDYILKINNEKLNKSYVETIAGQWKRLNIRTVEEALDIAQKEHNKYKKKKEGKFAIKNEADTPDWFDKKIEKNETTDVERESMEDLLKEFR